MCIFSAILLISASTTSFATTSEQSVLPITDQKLFSDFSCIFNGEGRVFDSASNNITNQFIIANINSFENDDFNSIKDYIFNNDISRIEIEPVIRTRAILNSNYSRTVYHLIENTKAPFAGKKWYFIVTASGNSSYNDGYAQYISFSTPTITFSYSDEGALFSGSIVSVNTTPVTMSNNKGTASSTVTSVHQMTGPSPIDGFSLSLGSFTNVSNFSITGP